MFWWTEHCLYDGSRSPRLYSFSQVLFLERFVVMKLYKGILNRKPPPRPPCEQKNKIFFALKYKNRIINIPKLQTALDLTPLTGME